MTTHRSRAMSAAEVRELSRLLSGAVAEGVDMGSRAAQIWRLGASLSDPIGALELTLAQFEDEVLVDRKPVDPGLLRRAAVSARGYRRPDEKTASANWSGLDRGHAYA